MLWAVDEISTSQTIFRARLEVMGVSYRHERIDRLQLCPDLVQVSKTYCHKAKTRTYSEGTVPTSRAKCHSVCANTQTTDSIFMTCQNTYTLPFKRVPDVAGPVIVAAEKDTA